MMDSKAMEAKSVKAGSMEKKPFDLEVALPLMEEALKLFPRAGLFELADEGYSSVFEILVACILSIRTLDEVMLAAARKLFARARTPAEIAALNVDELDKLISACTFHPNKARQIQAIAARLVAEQEGKLPCDRDLLLSFAGVGPKCANLVLGITCGQPGIAVDVHVHRVTNRWGYVYAPTPETTLAALEVKVPRRHWIEMNQWIMPFGKFICTGARPHCSTCPLLTMCPQIGVTNPR